MSAPVIRLASPARQILLFSKDPLLRYTRAEVLVSFGYFLAAPVSDIETFRSIESQLFDVLILCDTVDPEGKIRVATMYREIQPLGRIIEILPSPSSEPLVNPNATVVGLDGPLALHRVIENLLQQAR